MEIKKTFESFINETSRRKVHKAAKQGSYPAVIVVVQDGKVIHQEPVSSPQVAPATFNVMQEKYPKAVLHLEDKTGKRLFSESIVTESVFSFKTDNVEQLHFETDPATAELMKIELGKSQGEINKRKQIEGGEYSLRRFRKSINYGDGKDVGVFLPGSYDAAVSKLGDGPHKKAVKAVKWNQKKYDQWLEDMAANGGAENAFDMAQNAKNETGLIDWVKKQFRGDDPLQRIQWDIEGYVESIVTEAKDNLYLQLHKKYAEQIKGLKAGKIKKLTDLVSVQRWSMEDREDYFGMDSKKKKELSAEYNEERKLFKKYIAGDESVMLPKGTEALAEKVLNEASEDRMIKQIERALKDGTSIFKLPMATQKYYNKNKSEFEVVTEAKNTIGLAFKEEQDYLDFKEFVAEQPRGAIRKNIGFDSKTKSWEVIMDVKVLDSIYGEGTPGNKESGWYGALPGDFESVIIESVVTEAKDMTFTDYLKVLDTKFEDAMSAVKGENGSDTEITPTRGDILQNFTLFRNYVSSLTKKYKDDKTKLRFLTEKVSEYESSMSESAIIESISKSTKIHCIATPAPKSMLKDELEELFGDDYRNIVTEVEDDEGYESVLVFNLTKRDIKLIEDNIGDVLIWEYSIKAGKLINESYDEDDINITYGFYGTVADNSDEKNAKKLFDQGIKDLKKKYRLTEKEALAVLNSKMGRKAADQIYDDQAKTAIKGLETYYGKTLHKELADIQKNMVFEAKDFNRAEVMDFLENHLKFIRTSEEFDGVEGGIWTSAENGETMGSSRIFDYYSTSSKYEFGVLNKFAKKLSKMGWYCEYYDPGTVMIWPI